MIKTLTTILLTLLALHTIADVRIDRYTLLQDVETQAQANPLDVIINIKFPENVINVNQAIKHLLARSGYSFYESYEGKIIEEYRLPEVHRKIGPIPLKRALKVLLGNTWQINIDHLHRSISIVQSGQNSLHTIKPTVAQIIDSVTKKTSLDEVIAIDIVDQKFSEVLPKILPKNWKYRIDSSSVSNKVVNITSDSQTRKQILDRLIQNSQSTGYFFENLKILVIKENLQVIK
jgi:conjugative transfer region protein (TIGR03748 family)